MQPAGNRGRKYISCPRRLQRRLLSLHHTSRNLPRMALTRTPDCEFGRQVPDFQLPGIDGRDWSLRECAGERATVVMLSSRR